MHRKFENNWSTLNEYWDKVHKKCHKCVQNIFQTEVDKKIYLVLAAIYGHALKGGGRTVRRTFGSFRKAYNKKIFSIKTMHNPP